MKSHTLTNQYQAFLHQYKGVYADSTHTELHRRYARLTRTLNTFGIDNVVNIDVEVVKTLAIHQQNRGIKQKSVLHDLTAIGNLCKFYGNNAVDESRIKYPALFYTPRSLRLPPLAKSELQAILHACHKLAKSSDYVHVRSAGAVALCLGAGLRTIELRNVRIDGIDLLRRTVRVDVVKGGNTYGEPRTIPLIPSTVATIKQFLQARATQPPTISLSKFVLANPTSGAILSANTLRRDKKHIEELVGFDFDFRILRRTYAQILLDKDAPLSAVSVVMGHNSTVTTEQAYARIRPDSAIAQIQGVF